ncbi:MAG TPA: HAD-IA family hydrolase [Nocardioidaceae bacterium]|nr:HAD-IA family hydrolase [Nocardioidaceae bacterium]
MIRAVLLDADGVVQENPDGWLDDLKAFVAEGDGQAFVDDLFATEEPAMTGERGFRDVVAEVAGRWGLPERVEELLGHWRRIEVSAPVVALAGELRGSGLRCCLATNQNSFRAAYMKQSLGYDEVFDGAFYSCDLGVLKSSPAFFTRALERLRLPAAEVLFVDDSERYVDTARDVGLHGELWSTCEGIEVLRDRLGALGIGG